MAPERVEMVVKTMCALHNFLRNVNDPTYVPIGFADCVCQDGTIEEGFWRDAPHLDINVAATQARHATAEANEIREKFVSYFCSDHGSVPWQWDYIRRR